MMHPGKYPSRAVFSAPKAEKDAIGNPSTELEELGKAWVAVQPLSAREAMNAGGESAKVSHKVRLQAPSFEIPVNAVLTAQGRVFAVETVLEGLFEPEWTLICSEKRA